MSTKSNLGKRRAEALHEKNNASYHEKHQEVVAAASEIFLQKGYDGTKLRDISDALGMDRATLYYYASSKKNLFDEVLKNASEKNIDFIEGLVERDIPAREKLVLALDALMTSYRRDYPYLAIFLQQYLHSSSDESVGLTEESGVWGRRYYTALRSIMKEGLEKGEFAFALPVGVTTNAVIGMINWIHLARGPNAAKEMNSGKRDSSREAIDREVSNFVLKALGK